MTMSIWKYHLDITSDAQSVEMPKDAQIISVQNQGCRITMWAIVNPAADKEVRQFRIWGTGWQIDDYHLDLCDFVGTVQIEGFVWHVFEYLEPRKGE